MTCYCNRHDKWSKLYSERTIEIDLQMIWESCLWCLTKHHAMKTYGWHLGIAPHIIFGNRQR